MVEGETTKQVVPNPTGKGGFGDHPENINPTGRPKNADSITYWLNFFKNLPIADFTKYRETRMDAVMTMAELAAYTRVAKMMKDFKEYQDVANRTEGMPRQQITMGVDETIGEIEVKIRHEAQSRGDKSIPEKL